MINDLNFSPWIPSNYGTGMYERLLIIGESHYIQDERQEDDIIEEARKLLQHQPVSSFTSGIIESYIDGIVDINFYRNLGLAFNPNDRFEVCNKAAFANAIQIPSVEASDQPEVKHIETFIPGFWAILKEVRPDKVIICSKRMWNYSPPDYDERGKYVESIEEGSCKSTIWKYNYEEGECFATGINHPSSFFSHSSWHPFIQKFLKSY